MTRLAFWVSMLAAGSGMGLIIPASPSYWPYYSAILIIHMAVSMLLALLIIGVMFTHVRKAVKQTSKGQVRRATGLWYLIVIIVTIGSGVFISVRSGFAVSWVLPLHLMAGVWCSIMGWRHSVRKKVKPVVKAYYGFTKDTNA